MLTGSWPDQKHKIPSKITDLSSQCKWHGLLDLFLKLKNCKFGEIDDARLFPIKLQTSSSLNGTKNRNKNQQSTNDVTYRNADVISKGREATHLPN